MNKTQAMYTTDYYDYTNENVEIRISLAKSEATPYSVLFILSKDKHEVVRDNALNNKKFVKRTKQRYKYVHVTPHEKEMLQNLFIDDASIENRGTIIITVLIVTIFFFAFLIIS